MTARTLGPLAVTALAGFLAACHGSAVVGTPSPTPPAPAAAVPSAPLSALESRIRDSVRAHHDADIALLEKAVNISSGSQNAAGVRKVGELFGEELKALGFNVRISEMPATMRRGGHLIAEHAGTAGPRILLIGHLDTVFEGEGQRFVRTDSIARGAGTSDMKGGDVALIAALRALKVNGALENARISVIMTGDEEATGSPLELARKDLIDLAKKSDIALAFEGGSASRASIARRGSSSWELHTSARQGHSSGVFNGGGFGAVYEMARILDAIRVQLSNDPTLTINSAIVAGGVDVARDSSGAMHAAGKTNIIAPGGLAVGDLRFLRESQKDSARAKMREIVAQHLRGTDANITFRDGYPAMPQTVAGSALLAQFDAVSRAMGYGAVQGDPPESRGAGDVSFVAPYIVGMDGLGVSGRGAHSPDESVNLKSLIMSAERAAVLIRRLTSGAAAIPNLVP
jgi:glutamate carboxypeptidase